MSEAGKYKERIAVLRSMMRERGIDIYIVPTSDYHASEYVGEHFKERAFLTGFTGSAGTAVVTLTEACLWTDGRYFIQAKKQLSGSGIVLQRMGEPGVPQIFEYVQEHLKQKGCIAFDGRCMSYKEAEAYLTLAEKRGGRVQTDEDLVGQIWKDRPELPKNEVFILGEEYAGETSEKKLGRIREKLQQSVGEEDYGHLISCLYDIAWILNLRGNDICHVPVFLSYLYITKDQVILYANSENWSGKVLEYLQRQQVRLRPYAAVYEDLAACMQETVVLDLSSVNLRLCEAAAGQGARNILDIKNPAERMRAVKNQTEIANTLEAHRKDGVAVTKFLYYLKTEMAKGRCLSELDAEQYLYRMRKEQEDFLDVSFDTISAYGANAAMMPLYCDAGILCHASAGRVSSGRFGRALSAGDYGYYQDDCAGAFDRSDETLFYVGFKSESSPGGCTFSIRMLRSESGCAFPWDPVGIWSGLSVWNRPWRGTYSECT